MADVRLIDANPIEATPIYTTSCSEDYVSGYLDGANAVMRMVHNAPTIDPETLRPVGRWANSEDFFGNPYVWTCTNCAESLVMEDWGKPQDSNYKFCPYCGAKMEDDTCQRFAAWREQHKAEVEYNAICHELESIGRHDYDKESWMGGRRLPRKRRKA